MLGLFSKVAFADVNPAVLALENLWLITVAVTLLVNQGAPEPQPAIAERLFDRRPERLEVATTRQSG